MRIVKWFKLILEDIYQSDCGTAIILGLWALLLVVDLFVGTCAKDDYPGQKWHWFMWSSPAQILPAIYGIWYLKRIPYFKEKWEQTKTNESDKDTLLRGSKEKV